MSKYLIEVDFDINPLNNKKSDSIIKEILEDGLGLLDFRKSIKLKSEKIIVIKQE